MTRVTLEEARDRLPELVRAAARGEEVVITDADRPAVRLVPAGAGKPRARFGSARGKIWMAEDFDAPLDDFKDYM